MQENLITKENFYEMMKNMKQLKLNKLIRDLPQFDGVCDSCQKELIDKQIVILPIYEISEVNTIGAYLYQCLECHLKYEKSRIKTKIVHYINSNEEYITIPTMPLSRIVKIFQELGFEQDEYEANGWQVDFWLYFKHPKINDRYLVSGGLWYNDSFILTREETEEES